MFHHNGLTIQKGWIILVSSKKKSENVLEEGGPKESLEVSRSVLFDRIL